MYYIIILCSIYTQSIRKVYITVLFSNKNMNILKFKKQANEKLTKTIIQAIEFDLRESL